MNDLTEAQARALLWLCEIRQTTGIPLKFRPDPEALTKLEFRGGDFINYYQDRHREKHQAWCREQGVSVRPDSWYRYTAGTGRVHSWRRQGGLMLRRMADKGALVMTHFAIGIPIYALSQSGLDWVVEQWKIESESRSKAEALS